MKAGIGSYTIQGGWDHTIYDGGGGVSTEFKMAAVEYITANTFPGWGLNKDL